MPNSPSLSVRFRTNALLADEIVTKTDLVASAKDIEAKLQELKADLIKWMIGQTFAVAALVFAIAHLVR
jgi:hypothetical protein